MAEMDLIVDVILDGRVLYPQEIPPTVSAEVDALLARGEGPKEIHHEGTGYLLFVRPCVYPYSSLHSHASPGTEPRASASGSVPAPLRSRLGLGRPFIQGSMGLIQVKTVIIPFSRLK